MSGFELTDDVLLEGVFANDVHYEEDGITIERRALVEANLVIVSADVLSDLIDWDDCDFDHSGNCQAHNWFGEGECPHARAKRLMGER